MSVMTADVARSHSRRRCKIALEFSSAPAASLRVVRQADATTIALAGHGLDWPILERWKARLEQIGARAHARHDPDPAAAERHVICLDARVADLATAYADAAGACFSGCSTPAMAARVREFAPGSTMTLILLADRLDETMCHAVARANHERRSRGLPAVRYGILCAPTPSHLAWLMAKSVAMLAVMPLTRAILADWDFSAPRTAAVSVDSRGGAARRHIASPWSDPEVDLVSVRAHGASFDLSLGETVLCGRGKWPLPENLAERGPSCLHDGHCFRISGATASARHLLPVTEAAPLVWFLDSCASTPFAQNAFGLATSHVYGLLAGAATAVISPFLDIPTAGGAAQHLRPLIACGATLGEAAEAVSRIEPCDGFDRFLLLGSPDLVLLPRRIIEPEPVEDLRLYRIRGRHFAWRLAVGEGVATTHVVQDDGAPAWEDARIARLVDGAGGSLLVSLSEPAEIDGGLVLGEGGEPQHALAARALRILENLKLLQLHPFTGAADLLGACEAAATDLIEATATGTRLRGRVEAALALARLEFALDALQPDVAQAFLKRVASQDVSLDRLPPVGFRLEPTQRSSDACRSCGSAIYRTSSAWLDDPRVRREWYQCANCGGLALVREDSPFDTSFTVTQASSDRLEMSLWVRNRSAAPVKATIAGAPRRGPAATHEPPRTISLAPGAAQAVSFLLDQELDRGVISYRVLVLADGAVDLFALRHSMPERPSQPSGGA